MKTKRILGAITAIAMSASAFAGLGCVASADDTYDDLVLTATNSGIINQNGGYASYDGTTSIALNGANQGSDNSHWGSDGIVEFKISEIVIPDGAKIKSATLDIYVEKDIQPNNSYRALGVIGLDTEATISSYSQTVPTTSGTTYDAQDIYLTKNVSYSDGTKAGSWTVTDYIETQYEAEDGFIQFYLDAQFTTNATSAHGWTVYGYNTSYPPTLTISFMSASVEQYTVNMSCVDESTNEAISGLTIAPFKVDDGDTITLSKYYTTPYYSGDYKYEFAGCYDSDGNLIEEDTLTISKDTSITVRYTKSERGKYTPTLNLVCDGVIIDTVTSEEMYKDETDTLYYPAYITDGNGYVTYECTGYTTDSSQNNRKNYVQTVTGETSPVNISYAAYSGTAQYFEGDGTVLSNTSRTAQFSNGEFQTIGTTQTDLLTVTQDGDYTLTIVASGTVVNTAYYLTVYVNDVAESDQIQISYGGENTGTYTLSSLSKGDVISAVATDSRSGVDYALLEATSDLDPIITSVTSEKATLPATTETTYKEVVNGEATDTTDDLAGKEVTSYVIAVRNWSSGIPNITLSDGETLTPTEIDSTTTPYYYTSGNYYYFVIQTYGIEATAKTVSLTDAADYTIE